MKSCKAFTLSMTVACIIASTAVYADVDLSRVVDVIRKTPANNDFVLPSDSRFERKWQNFTRSSKGNVRHNIGDAFVLIDTTVMGACDEGVLIDRLGITVQHDFSDDNGFIPWTAFAANGTVSQEDALGDELVLFKSPKIAAHFEKSDFKIDNARSFFDRLLIAIRNGQNNATISSSTARQQNQGSAQVNIQDVIFNKRIEKFGGFYLGGKIKLPLRDDYDEQFNNSDWVDHGGMSFRYDERSHSIVMFDRFPSRHDICGVWRYTSVTPKTRLVKSVQLSFSAKEKGVLMANVKDELREAIGLPLFMDEGQLKADKGRQLVTFQTQNDDRDGDVISCLHVRIIDYGSIDAENNYVQAQKEKQKNELQRWIDDLNSRPPFTSFCGIEFGTRLTGDLERTEDGQYLYGDVDLKTPFRGCDTAKVYASIKSHRIFRVEIETKDPPSVLSGGAYTDAYIYDENSVLAKRYKPNGNPLINLDSYLATFNGDKWRETVRLRKLLWDSGYSCEGYNLNGGKINIESREVGTGSFYNTVEEHGNYAFAVTKERQKEVGVLIATSYKYEKIANKEYEKESGGDGSEVL